MQKYQSEVNSKVDDITVTVFNCTEGETAFGCADNNAHFPRIKFYDHKKEIEYNLTQENFEQNLIKVKNYAVPRILLVKSEQYLKELFDVTSHNFIGYFHAKKETAKMDSLRRLAKMRKNSPLFIEVSLIDDSLVNSEAMNKHFTEGEGIYFWLNDPKAGPKRLEKFKFEHDDGESLLAYAEVESTPEVVYFQEKDFAKVFAGALKTQVIMFVDNFDKDSDKIDILRQAAKHNRKEDFFYQRLIFVAYEIGTDPEMEVAFGTISSGTVFLTSIMREEFLRFKFKDSLTSENLIRFYTDFREKKLQPFYLSETNHTQDVFLPDSKVLRVVAEQFREKIVIPQMNYLVLFCSEKDNCKMAIDMLKFVDKYIPNRDILNFAFMNAELNEVRSSNPR